MRASLSKTKQNKKASNTHKSEQFLSAGAPLCVLSHLRGNHSSDPQFESLHSASLSKPGNVGPVPLHLLCCLNTTVLKQRSFSSCLFVSLTLVSVGI